MSDTNFNSINSKTSKKGLVDFLGDTVRTVKSKGLSNLYDRMIYTLKGVQENSAQVLKEDLYQLAKEVQDSLEEQPALASIAPVENSLKTVKKTEDANPPAPPKETKPAEGNKTPAPAADTKKKTPTVKASAKSVVTTNDKKSEKEFVIAQQFAPEFESKGLGKLRVNIELKTMKELFDQTQEGKEFIFAMYWSKRHLKQYVYDTYSINKEKFVEFENDLDLCRVIYVSEEGTVAYLLSLYSEVVYTITPDDLEMSDGMRFTNGIEYNIYEIYEEESAAADAGDDAAK